MLKVEMAPSTPKSPAAKTAAKPARPAKADGPASAPKPAAKGADAAAAKASVKAKDKAKPAAKPGNDLVRLKDIIETVAAATGLKKPDAKKAVDATLTAIAAALGKKSILALPPLGKLRVAKVADGVMTLKLRQAGASGPKGLALAQDDEDS
jgi:hypothetical protein